MAIIHLYGYNPMFLIPFASLFFFTEAEDQQQYTQTATAPDSTPTFQVQVSLLLSHLPSKS